jgi:hypothetical protein
MWICLAMLLSACQEKEKDETGHLLWYRSHHYGSIAHLKRAIYPLIQEIESLSWLIIEGDRLLAEKWERVALQSDTMPLRPS